MLLAASPAAGAGLHPDRPAIRQALAVLMADDARLQTIGWRLARGNAAYCAVTHPATGLLLLDAANFRNPPAIRAALGLEGDIAIDAVAAGSPAQRAGLQAGEEILMLGGRTMAALPAVPPQDTGRLAGLHDALDAELARTGQAVLIVRNAAGAERRVVLQGEPACRVRFAIGPAGQKPVAAAFAVLLGQADVQEEGTAIAEAITAHELAHVLLGHSALGKPASALRGQEAAADRLAPWLLANAGYDPAAMLRLAESRRHKDRLLAPASHGSWRSRAGAIRAELGILASAGSPPLDWRARFALPVSEAP